MEADTVDSIIRGFHMYGDSWSPVISEVLVCELLNENLVVFYFEHGPTKTSTYMVPLAPCERVRALYMQAATCHQRHKGHSILAWRYESCSEV